MKIWLVAVGSMFLHFSLQGCLIPQDDHKEAIRDFLISENSDPTVFNLLCTLSLGNTGDTLLHEAVQANDDEFIEKVCTNKNLNPNILSIKNSKQKTPHDLALTPKTKNLLEAAQKGPEEMKRFLYHQKSYLGNVFANVKDRDLFWIP